VDWILMFTKSKVWQVLVFTGTNRNFIHKMSNW